MSNLARLVAIVALLTWPTAALANVPPPEDEPAAPLTQPQTDPNAPVINDAPPQPATAPDAPSPTDTSTPPEIVQEPAADAPAASNGGMSTGLAIGVGAVVLVLVVGGAMWFMRT